MAQNILIVDDSPSIRRMIAGALVAAGFKVTVCESAQQALAAASGSSLDAVVTDLNMPEMDGLELTRRLRMSAGAASCPILILTTENSAARKQEAKLAGASGWVLKPFQEETLVRAIRTVCEKAGSKS